MPIGTNVWTLSSRERAPRGRWYTLALGAGLALFTACEPARPILPAAPPPAVAPLPSEIRVRVGDRIVHVRLEDYVLGTILAEITPVGEADATVERIYTVQAILARTYVLAHLGRHGSEGFDVCDSTHCQIYDPERIRTSRFAAAAVRAVERTRGQVLWYGGHPADALFHADCGGYTAAPETIWGTSPVAYLRAAPDDPPNVAHRTWQVSVGREELRSMLNQDPLSQVGQRLDAVLVLAHDAGGRAATVVLDGERASVVRGEELRTILNRRLPGSGIQSTKFSVTRRGATFLFEGAGFGHGVGLCQRGALARARLGASVEDILHYYFPGTQLGR